MQAHTDVLVYNDTTENHIDDIVNTHEKEHHKNYSDDEKNSDHHHHCISINLINVFIPVDNQVSFTDFSLLKNIVIYYETPNYQSYIDSVFQPPKSI